MSEIGGLGGIDRGGSQFDKPSNRKDLLKRWIERFKKPSATKSSSGDSEGSSPMNIGSAATLDTNGERKIGQPPEGSNSPGEYGSDGRVKK